MKRALGWAAILLLCGRSGARAATTVNSHTLYFNNCQPNGCTIHLGPTLTLFGALLGLSRPCRQHRTSTNAQ